MISYYVEKIKKLDFNFKNNNKKENFVSLIGKTGKPATKNLGQSIIIYDDDVDNNTI